MNMFDEATSLSGMIEILGATQSELSEKLGVSQSYVANKLRLLRFSEAMRERILSAGLSERHARTLLRLSSEKEQSEAIERIEKGRLSVAESEILVDRLQSERAPEKIRKTTDAERIGCFENVIDESIKTLAVFGIKARKDVDKIGDKTAIRILIG